MIKKLFTLLLYISSVKVAFSQLSADSLIKADSNIAIITGIIKTEKDSILSNIKIDISNNKKKYSVFSDASGKYIIEIEPGKYTISVKHPSFNDYVFKNVNIVKGEVKNLEIYLIGKIVSTEEIDVYGTFRQDQDDLRTSVYNLNPQEVKALPGAVEDVMRSLQSLPGVSSPNDFTSQLVIRGSGPDQNLIIMDDVEIFNPYRLYGLVSMFNPETLSDITLITGGFPAKYGDRLSAVLDVSNKEGDRNSSLNGIINASIANANVIFNGKNPLNIPGSWLISSRRTYYDLIVGPFARNAKLITDDSSFPSFRDLQFKFVTGPFNKNSFILNGVFSNDGVDIIPGSENKNPDSVAVTDVTKNDMLALAWFYNPDKDFFSRTTLSWYRNSGDNDFNSELLDPLIDGENYTPEQRDSLRLIGAILGLQFNSQYTFRKYSLGNKSVINNKNSQQEFGGGIDIVRTDLSYNLKVDDNLRAFINNFPTGSAFNDDFYLEGEDNIRAYIYAQSMFKLNKKLFVQPSLRFDYFQIIQTPYLAPRINVGYALDPLTTLRGSIGVYYQSPGLEKLVDGRTFYDLRGVSETGLKAEQAIHYIFGFERWIDNQWLARFESYYKKFNNLIEQQELTGYRYEYTLKDPGSEDPVYIKDSKNWIRSDEKLPYDSLTTVPVNAGNGEAYGFEISLERKYTSPKTKLYGWINYSLSFSNRSKYDVTYPYRFDQRNVANIVLNYRINNRFEVGARWSYASNFPFTPPVGITPRLVGDSIAVNPTNGDVIFNLDFGGNENLYSEVRPAYHRLDVRFTAYTNFWSANWAFYLDVINAYNRKNVLGYDYSLDENLVLKRRTIGMFPILPTLGVNVKF